MIQSRSRATTVAVLLAVALSLAPMASRADDGESLEEAGMGAAAMLTTLVYGPVKLAYAATGGVVGGLAWLLTGGNSEVAVSILEPAVYGDYYVTPGVLRGEESIEFVGRGAADARGVASDGVPDAPAPEGGDGF